MNEKYIRYTFEKMKAENELIEIRAISSRSNYSGYFKSVDNLISEIKRYENCNIYFVLNKISDACYSREQTERFIEKAKNTTSDNDITNREWLLIDIDPKRSAGVSSSDEEKNKSKKTINDVFAWLRDFGFPEPIVADSGNGFHLLYKINLPNNDESKELIKTVLSVLDMYFVNEFCDIDKTVFNASRITKLYGTAARKGNSTEQRPHRESYFVRVPDVIKETPTVLLQKVADLFPKQDKPTFNNNYNADRFDLSNFLVKNGINVRQQQNFALGTKYILDSCFFDESHKGKDAAIFEMQNGAIAYKCLHNSCSHKKWQDVRLLFEPDAYNRNYEINRSTTPQKAILQPQDVENEKGNKFLNLSDIKSIDRNKIVSMASGFRELDNKIIGFNKGEITLWSGKNGSAKSTIINQISVNSIQSGFKGIIFSGELQGYKIKNWIHLQCAGRQFTNPTKYENVFFVKDSVSDKIDKWLKDKLYIYNNDYGNKFEQLMCDIESFVQNNGIDFIVLDNLMAIDLLTLEGDKFEKQTRFINRLCESVRKFNYHLHIVAHPRKNTGFLRKDDISGSADLTNAVDNVIICHRNNNDYKKAINEFFPKESCFNLVTHDNYLEVCKNRDLGIVDLMCGLYYEIESKRLLNDKYENLVYSWQDIEAQQTIQQVPQSFYEPIKPNENFLDEEILPF